MTSWHMETDSLRLPWSGQETCYGRSLEHFDIFTKAIDCPCFQPLKLGYLSHNGCASDIIDIAIYTYHHNITSLIKGNIISMITVKSQRHFQLPSSVLWCCAATKKTMFLVTEGLGRGRYYHTDTFISPLVTSCGWEQVKGTLSLSTLVSL